MQTGTPRSDLNEREFLAAGEPGATGRVRRLAVVSALPQPPTPQSESTRPERLVYEDPTG